METTKDLSDGTELMEDNNAYGNQKYIAIADGDPKIVDDGYSDKLNNLGDELGTTYPPPPPPMQLPTIPLSPIPQQPQLPAILPFNVLGLLNSVSNLNSVQ